MKKILLLLLFVFSNLSYAEWDLIYKDAKIKSEYFLNLENPIIIKQKVRVWTLENFLDLQKTNALEYHSVKSFVEFDCDASKLRIMAYSLYGEKMANGKAIYSKGDSLEWMQINDDTVFSLYSKIACSESKL